MEAGTGNGGCQAGPGLNVQGWDASGSSRQGGQKGRSGQEQRGELASWTVGVSSVAETDGWCAGGAVWEERVGCEEGELCPT